MFCARHIDEHRQELGIQLENTMQGYNYVQEQSSQLKVNQSILSKIDRWKQTSIAQVQEMVEKTRADYHQWYQSVHDRIKKECTELATTLVVAHDNNYFSESDPKNWKNLLKDLKTQLESTANVNIVEERQ